MKWTPASKPPEETGAFLVWCAVGSSLTDPAWLALAFKVINRPWIEMLRGSFHSVIPAENVLWWQPAPGSPEYNRE